MSGDSNGNIIVWGRGTNTILKLVRGVHDGSIFSLCCLKEGQVVSGGGKDGRIVLFDPDMNAAGQENVVSVYLIIIITFLVVISHCTFQ